MGGCGSGGCNFARKHTERERRRGCRHGEGSGCSRNKLRRRTGVWSKVRLRKECEGDNRARDGGGETERRAAPREERAGRAARGDGGAAARLCKKDLNAQSCRRPDAARGTEGTGGVRRPVGGASGSVVGRFQLPASSCARRRRSAPPPPARTGSRAGPRSTGGCTPWLLGRGGWKANASPAGLSGETQPQVTIAPGFGAHAAFQGCLPYPGVHTFLCETYINRRVRVPEIYIYGI